MDRVCFHFDNLSQFKTEKSVPNILSKFCNSDFNTKSASDICTSYEDLINNINNNLIVIRYQIAMLNLDVCCDGSYISEWTNFKIEKIIKDYDDLFRNQIVETTKISISLKFVITDNGKNIMFEPTFQSETSTRRFNHPDLSDDGNDDDDIIDFSEWYIIENTDVDIKSLSEYNTESILA